MQINNIYISAFNTAAKKIKISTWTIWSQTLGTLQCLCSNLLESVLPGSGLDTTALDWYAENKWGVWSDDVSPLVLLSWEFLLVWILEKVLKLALRMTSPQSRFFLCIKIDFKDVLKKKSNPLKCPHLARSCETSAKLCLDNAEIMCTFM